MKLLKLLTFFFLIYFIRKFIQMYRTLKKVQLLQEEERNKSEAQNGKNSDAVEAEYKVVD